MTVVEEYLVLFSIFSFGATTFPSSPLTSSPTQPSNPQTELYYLPPSSPLADSSELWLQIFSLSLLLPSEIQPPSSHPKLTSIILEVSLQQPNPKFIATPNTSSSTSLNNIRKKKT
jgi:hypothetical protein